MRTAKVDMLGTGESRVLVENRMSQGGEEGKRTKTRTPPSGSLGPEGLVSSQSHYEPESL